MATRVSPPQNKTYYINPAYLTFVENSGYGANLIQVSASSSCYISVYDPANDINYSDADRNYQRWKVTAYNNKFPNDSFHYIYVRLERNGTSALVIYDTVLRGVHGGEIVEQPDEQGNMVKVEGEYDPEHPYYYILMGEVSATDGTSIRSITYDTGYLETDQGRNEDNSALSEMWELNKYSVPPLIVAKQWLQDFVVKGFIKLIGGLKFSKGKDGDEKIITDVKRSIDGDEEFLLGEDGEPLKDENGEPIPDPSYMPSNDETLVTSLYLEKKIDKIESDKFLRKDQPDRTPYDLSVGGVLSAETSILFQEKQISGFIRYYDNPRPEIVTDVDFYSALMTDKRIEEELRNLDDRYLRKDKEDTAHKHITFEEGITVYGLAKMMRLEVSELATIARAIVDVLGSAKFVDGFFGEGYQIWKSIASDDWCLTIDRLTVRKVMTVYELLIQKIRSVGGMLVVSAGNGKIKEVERVGLEYKISFEDTNTFVENDLIRCQVWTGTGIKYYWVEVLRVKDGCIYTRVDEFEGEVPEPGDEVVLMGNTKNKLRQNLLVLSATEDGQPRFDCIDGVNTKNFEGCLRTRVGCLDGISDDLFPPGLQPQGYGLYADNCYLRGVFVLSTGVDVQTQFTIMEGQIGASLSKVQQQINEEENYLFNASFTSNLDGWEYVNDVRIFNTSGGLLHFNDEFYSDKRRFAGIVSEQGMNVLRLKNSHVLQTNDNYAKHPEFRKVEKTTKDEEGNEVGTGELVYRPTMFYASFKYKVKSRGRLTVRFMEEQVKEDFEEYEPLFFSEEIGESDEFLTFESAGKWNGTGNFCIEFTGEMLLYSAALADNKLADMEEWWSMNLEITEKKIQANAEHIRQQGENLEAYRSEFLFTAEQLRTEFTELIENKEKDITESYTGLVNQTARKLESDYTAKIGDYYGKVTEEYNSKITQTAKDITAELTARIDNTDKALDEAEAALIKDYTAKISASAESLKSDYNAKITDLKTGDIATMKSSIQQNASQIATKVSQTNFDALTQRVVTAETSIKQTAQDITLLATKGELANEVDLINDLTDAIVDDVAANAAAAQKAQARADSAYNYASTNFSRIQEEAGRISAVAGSINVDPKTGLITNISTSGLVLEDNFAGLFSEQVTSQGVAKTAQLNAYVLETELGDLVSEIEISADQIDLSGVVTYDMLSGTLQNELDDKATSSELSSAQAELNSSISSLNSSIGSLNNTIYWMQTDLDKKATIDSLNSKVSELNNALLGKADVDLANAAVKGTTLIVGGYINTELIQASQLRITGSQVSGLGSLAYLNSVSASNVSGLGSLATYNEVLDAMKDESIIVGGYIKTSMIDVDSLLVKRLEASDGSYTYSLNSSGFSITSGSTTLCTLNVNSAAPIFYLAKNPETVSIAATGMTYSSSSTSCSMNSYGISFYNGSGINNLTIRGLDSRLYSSSDFVNLTSNESLPSPASCPGKIIFVHATSKNYTVSCSNKIIKADGTGVASSVSIGGAGIFISDGTYWYEFHCE